MAGIGGWLRRLAAGSSGDLAARGPVGGASPGGSSDVTGLGAGLRGLADQHLLLVPTTVHIEDVDAVLRARMPRCSLARTGEARLGRHSRLTGPYELSMEDAVDAAVPMPWTLAYALESPVEREDPPIPGMDDRDGFAFAFPQGLPWREEGRGLHLLVSMARRLGGAVRAAGSLEIIQPDPDRAVDYLVHAAFWVDPQTLLGVVARHLPTARLAVEGEDWAGPDEAAYTGAAVAADTADDPIRSADLAALHARADAADVRAMATGEVLDAYAVVGEVSGGADGAVEVLVHLGEPDEPAVAEEEWAGSVFVTYEIRWACPDPGEREQRQPSPHFLAARARVGPVVRGVAHAVVEATSGVVTDEDGFWVDRYEL